MSGPVIGTRASAASTAGPGQTRQPAWTRKRRAGVARGGELAGLLAASLVIGGGLLLTYEAKTNSFPAFSARLQKHELVNLNALQRREELVTALQFLTSPADVLFAADRIQRLAATQSFSLPNVGAVGRLRVTEQDLQSNRALHSFAQRMQQARNERAERQKNAQAHQGKLSQWKERIERQIEGDSTQELTIPLLTFSQLQQFKSGVVVRAPEQFRSRVLWWSLLYFLSFYAVHVFWRLRGFSGDRLLLPLLHLLTGAGLILMLSLRDPLRDMMIMTSFAGSVLIGSVLLAASSQVDYEKLSSQLSFVPLALALLLCVLLFVFGTGPSGSDAKVNLFGLGQPVELIKILLVLFLAGYFGRHWEPLRYLREKSARVSAVAGWLRLPRLDYVMPLVLGTGGALALFYALRDLGPAMVIAFLVLALYSVARARVGAVLVSAAALGAGVTLGYQLSYPEKQDLSPTLVVLLAGLVLYGLQRRRWLWAGVGVAGLAAKFATGYQFYFPDTASQRILIWMSPWNNLVRGGDQVAHSLWALATGGLWGTGLGLGDPALIPAGHTDLILSSLGEEWGFAGLFAVLLLFALLITRGLKIGRRAPTDYQFFLALGMALLLGLPLLLISAGILGLFPLSGVVTPFLSYGGSAMWANFVVVGVLAAVSQQQGTAEQAAPFRVPLRYLGWTLGGLALIIAGRVVWAQVVQDETTMARGASVLLRDGTKSVEYNPRLTAVAREIPRGTIYDRHGLPLATSNTDVLAKAKGNYAQIGVTVDPLLQVRQTRYYPLGPAGFHLLGDYRRPYDDYWGASNNAILERDAGARLRGYGDLRELVPILRHRYDKDDRVVRAIMDRPRDVQTSIDAALQHRVSEILKTRLRALGREKGAAVVMDAETGDVLAVVSQPTPALLPGDPTASGPPQGLATLDRARYGLYPPGSSFKVITAMAALRIDPNLTQATFSCVRLPDGRVGNFVPGSNRPIRDDVKDRQPHGTLAMDKALVISCNAYFAQLGALKVGADALRQTANLFEISVDEPNHPEAMRYALPQASYGQGAVVATPFRMARAAATVANGGQMPYGRWVVDENNVRRKPNQPVISADLAAHLGQAMRRVVTEGTGKAAANSPVPIAGKTGTAEIRNAPSHAWFIGYAPYGAAQGRKLAFAVLVENGQYGGTAAAPIASEIMAAANSLGLFQEGR